jgi:peptidyl-prolyl cis-trans isomerase-like protein 2
MANSGPNTNARQFFITYKSCPHLNRKHSVFGKVIGGLEVLRRLEQVPTDKETDRPLEVIKIEEVEILENPMEVALELEKERILKRKEEKKEADHSRKSGLLGLGASNERVGQRSSDDSAATSYSAASDKKHTTNLSPFAIGKYLKTGSEKETKSTNKSSTANGDKDASDELNAAVKSRLPPPPKKTMFGDFSGW